MLKCLGKHGDCGGSGAWVPHFLYPYWMELVLFGHQYSLWWRACYKTTKLDNPIDFKSKTDCRVRLRRIEWLDRTYFFCSALLISTFILLFLLSSSVSLSYFNPAVPCPSVWENTRAWVPHFLYPYWIIWITDWNLLSSGTNTLVFNVL